ncbi:MAG: glycosyltransferase [Candidatus Aureabacteria bacterium]|nr:glycosyltransferase [Candidatus Auribacterota bacterium]
MPLKRDHIRFVILLLICSGIAYLWSDQTAFYDILSTVKYFFDFIRYQFQSLQDYDTNFSVKLPFYITLALTLLGIFIFPKPPRIISILAVALLAVSHTLYILFRTCCTLSYTDTFDFILMLLLWFTEAVIYLCSVSLYVQIFFKVNRSRQADQYSRDVISGRYAPPVDVFITTHSEPIDMIKRTAVGCQAMTYANKRVYILDDGNRDSVRLLAEELGCHYISRKNNIHAKAGNINHALAQTDGEFIALFDADCIPLNHFLIRTAGFFQENDVGMVIGSQAFYNGQIVEHNIMSLMEFSRFFQLTQSGRDYFNAILCYGTCYVVRRTAIEKIKGIPTETLSEDWATSIKLQGSNYKTYALNEILGAGAVAESMSEFLKQRIRWTQGTLQSLFSSTNPLTHKGLSLMQRAIHSYGLLHYLINPFYLCIIILPILYFFLGFSPFNISYEQFWIIIMPFFCLNFFVFSWLCNEFTSKISIFVSESYLSYHLTIAIMKTLLRPFGWKFRVTNKNMHRKDPHFNADIGVPQIIFIIFTLIGISYGYIHKDWQTSEALFYFLAIFSIVRILFLWIGLYASFDLPQLRKAVRMPQVIDCVLDTKTGSEACTTVNISENGVLLKCHSLNKINLETDALCSLNIFHLTIPVKFIRSQGSCIALSFIDLSLMAYRIIIEQLYCKPSQWDDQGNLDMKVLHALFHALTFKKIARP